MSQCSDAADLNQRIEAATGFIVNDDDAQTMLPALHYRYRDLMTQLRMRDMTAHELLGMIAILTEAHARKLSTASCPPPRLHFEMTGRSQRLVLVDAS